MFASSVKQHTEIFQFPPTLIPQSFTLSNFEEVWFLSKFNVFARNSVITSFTVAIAVIFSASLGAYSITRFKYRGRDAISQLILFVYMFPSILLLVPLYILMSRFNLTDNLGGLILCEYAISLPFGLWVLKAFFSTIPKELEEAALVDGCSKFQALYKIILPVAAPGIATVGILTFITSWNAYMLALVLLTSQDVMTLPIGVMMLFTAEPGKDYGLMMAATVIVTIPALLFAMFLQKYLIRGLTAGAVKG